MRRVLFVLLIALATLAPAADAAPQATPAALRIVVIEGEDAVNVVQQKTAVAPVVEVRDRNNQPVAGAVVRFAIQSGRANISGARALTVTTNAVGRATVTGLTPTGSGALHITATAAFQGQTAAVTIAQTNVMTAAQAAAAAGAGTSGGGAGAGATGGAAAGGGTGGGVSATTIAIVGGAAAGGTLGLQATGVLGGDSEDEYDGPFSGVIRHGFDGGGGCFRDEQHAGTVHVQFAVSDSGVISGTANIQATSTTLAFSTAPPTNCADAIGVATPYGCCVIEPTVSGTAPSVSFNASESYSTGATFTWSFAGTLNGSQIIGTLTETIRSGFFGGTSRYPVTLTKQ